MSILQKNRKTWLPILFLVGVIVSQSCSFQGRGFALPPGDMETGKMVFTSMKCNACHSTTDVEWLDEGDDLHLVLGGETTAVKTYGELVTSIINPRHKISEKFKKTNPDQSTLMGNYNELLSVQDLVDLVTYLQEEYDIITPPTYYYPF